MLLKLVALESLYRASRLAKLNFCVSNNLYDAYVPLPDIALVIYGFLWEVYVPRLSLQPSNISFKFQRRELSITVWFAMTINKSQGQSLKQVGIYLPQLYVRVSKITSRNN
ncbi:hypothetical protein MTR_7g498270 [Medicago truncatula]|uniref:PIF1 helicase n=1 Tax=Medicago truncatula TaxID=3880 RepID=A0A072U4C3_MEDTR|nr:hypothetical protein MTR_7g498270 [Medicago truncatula]